MVVRDGMSAALAGAAVGIIAALLLTRSMSSFLYGVRASDPLTFAVVSALLIAAAFVATFLPARRASRTDPLLALRGE
jgi:putative ABC transport system permease protein